MWFFVKLLWPLVIAFIIRPRSIIVAVDLIRRSNNCRRYSRDFGHGSYGYTKHCTRFHRQLKFLSRKRVSSSTNLVSLCRSIPQYSTQNDNFAHLIRNFPVNSRQHPPRSWSLRPKLMLVTTCVKRAFSNCRNRFRSITVDLRFWNCKTFMLSA